MDIRRNLTEEASGERIVTTESTDPPDVIDQGVGAARESEVRKTMTRQEGATAKIRKEDDCVVRTLSHPGRVRNITDASLTRRGAVMYRQAPAIEKALRLIERRNQDENPHQVAREERPNQTEERGTVMVTNRQLMVLATNIQF